MVEHEPEQPHPEGEAETGDRQAREDALERLAERIETLSRYPLLDVYVETRLRRVGFLPVLERSGILPVADDPNPHSEEMQPEEYQAWWEAHRSEEEEWDEQLMLREKILRSLWIGALLGRAAGDALFSSTDDLE